MVNRLHEFPLTDRQWNHNATKKTSSLTVRQLVFIYFIFTSTTTSRETTHWPPVTPMTSSDPLWHPLTSSDPLWHPLTSSDPLWHPLTSSDPLWHPLTSSDPLWHPLTSSDPLWHPLTLLTSSSSRVWSVSCFSSVDTRPTSLPRSISLACCCLSRRSWNAATTSVSQQQWTTTTMLILGQLHSIR